MQFIDVDSTEDGELGPGFGGGNTGKYDDAVTPIDADAIKKHGHWLVSKFAVPEPKFPCAGVKMPEQKYGTTPSS